MKQFDYRIAFLSLGLIIMTLVIAAFSTRSHIPTYSGSATLDFPNTAAGGTSDLTITVTGAATGDFVILSPSEGSITGNGGFIARVSSANTVTVTHFNNALLAGSNPASGVFYALVFKR